MGQWKILVADLVAIAVLAFGLAAGPLQTPRSEVVELTRQNKNRLISVQGPEITVRPVAGRIPTG
ncbi:hypothetical protein [Protofrankia symbiont of Coriaria ruscifolia]|uniref:Putative membrane protein n=1 Tax=Candidatus Protofrankia californiensis TaxID=1839754 RepID=A0A1C3P1Q9_9ACTN|nr:hypothetical protein [Protofrankia symbiont of Coriaria ruscifolia]SBW23787.1 putative membrane protein [Candidatus Protofrankia californiensis]